MTVLGMKGGEGFRAKLESIARKAGSGDLLRLGFLEGAAPEPDGTPVAYIAAVNEYGGSFEVKERQQTIYRKTNKDGSFANDGKFVKASKSNFATEHAVPAHTVTIPARPFFRQMIAAKSGQWGGKMARLMQANAYDVGKTLHIMGEGIQEQLRDSINEFSGVPLAASTIAKKGFDKQLIDQGNMLRSIGFELVKEG